MTWDVTKVPNYSTNFPDVGTGEDRQWNPITFALVTQMMLVGPLEADNGEEFYTRIKMLEEVFGAILHKSGADGKPEDVFITWDNVQKHVGIKVNVPRVTTAAFNKKIGEIVRRQAADAVRNELSA